MFDAELLEVLCCPETHRVVRLAELPLIARLNDLIAQGTLQNADWQFVKETIFWPRG